MMLCSCVMETGGCQRPFMVVSESTETKMKTPKAPRFSIENQSNSSILRDGKRRWRKMATIPGKAVEMVRDPYLQASGDNNGNQKHSEKRTQLFDEHRMMLKLINSWCRVMRLVECNDLILKLDLNTLFC
ncbi:hypothetical protein QVD17_38008 [Tagetes erecta]|uniref:Uncharacterized protein n=1 Tax=Tagetes erecta TaxID=13708 RepID=A0AAD8JV91_TARER|nr:hypothetical protein QVD17_38008 [Tagetes erecta]